MDTTTYILLAVAIVFGLAVIGLSIPLMLAGYKARIQEADEKLAREAAEMVMRPRMEEEEKKKKKENILSKRIKEAGLNTTATNWIIRNAVIGATLGLVCGVLLSNFLLIPIALLATFAFGFIQIESARKHRTSNFEEQLSDALPMVAENIRSGQSPASSMLAVAEYMGNPLHDEFERAASEMSYGVTFTRAMDNMYERVPCSDLRLLNGAIAINSESGGDLSKILDSIAETMQKRAQMRGHIRSITASARMSAGFVAVMPWALAALMLFLKPDYFDPLIQDPLIGVSVVLGAALLDIIGILIIRKLYNMKVD